MNVLETCSPQESQVAIISSYCGYHILHLHCSHYAYTSLRLLFRLFLFYNGCKIRSEFSINSLEHISTREPNTRQFFLNFPILNKTQSYPQTKYLPLKCSSHSLKSFHSESVRSFRSSIFSSTGVRTESSNDCFASPREASRPAKFP